MRNYGDIFTRKPATPTYPTQPATLGEVVEVLADGYVGAIVGHEKTYDGDFIRLENNQGKTRLFKLRPGAFLVDGIRTTLTKPQPAARPQRSNSGSTRVVNAPTKVAAPSRIWVEGVHDAAIVEKSGATTSASKALLSNTLKDSTTSPTGSPNSAPPRAAG